MGPPSPPAAALAVAFFLLLAQQPSAAAAEAAGLVSAPTTPRLPHSADLEASIDARKNAEAVVVYGSGRRLRASSHRRVLDLLRSARPVAVRLASGEERTFPCGADLAAHAHSAELQGAQLLVPAEAVPCDVVADVVDTERARRTHLVLPSGESVPYDRDPSQPPPLSLRPASPYALGYRHPYQPHALYHRQPAVYDWETPLGEPEDRLQVAIGGTQRLAMRVHDAILRRSEAAGPLAVDLVSGQRVAVDSYDELLRRTLDARYLDAKVVLDDGGRVPISTYRAVVDAHRHKAVYVVDPDDDHKRTPYAEYVKAKGGASAPDGKAESKAK